MFMVDKIRPIFFRCNKDRTLETTETSRSRIRNIYSTIFRWGLDQWRPSSRESDGRNVEVDDLEDPELYSFVANRTNVPIEQPRTGTNENTPIAASEIEYANQRSPQMQHANCILPEGSPRDIFNGRMPMTQPMSTTKEIIYDEASPSYTDAAKEMKKINPIQPLLIKTNMIWQMGLKS